MPIIRSQEIFFITTGLSSAHRCELTLSPTHLFLRIILHRRGRSLPNIDTWSSHPRHQCRRAEIRLTKNGEQSTPFAIFWVVELRIWERLKMDGHPCLSLGDSSVRGSKSSQYANDSELKHHVQLEHQIPLTHRPCVLDSDCADHMRWFNAHPKLKTSSPFQTL